MTWAAIIKLLMSLTLAMVDYARKRQAISEGEALITARALKESLDVLEKSEKARADAHRKFDDAGGMPDDNDPNLRD